MSDGTTNIAALLNRKIIWDKIIKRKRGIEKKNLINLIYLK